MSLKVLIADDEPIARDILTEYVSKVPTLELVGACSNALEVFAMLNKQGVDLLLLDINMPEVTGVDLLRSLKEPPMVIFTTAYSEYAIESYELNAIDYLLKPIAFDRFIKAVNKAQDATATQDPISITHTSDNAIFVRSDGKHIRVELSELLLIEGVKDYVRLHLQSGSILVHSTMKNIEEQLTAYNDFIRVHRSYLVNLKHIKEIEGNMLKLGDTTVVVGNTYKDKVAEILRRFKTI